MFSIFLDLSDPEKSKMVYGGLVSQFEDHPITYFKNYEKKYKLAKGHYISDHWKLAIDQARFGDAIIESTVANVIVDTGCTLHQAPKKFID